MMTGLLLGHRHNFSDALIRPQSAAAPFYVKRAEAFIEANFSEPISLADIAAHAAISARSLQNGFRVFRDMTPMQFVRTMRLKNAHTNLLTADPTTTTTTDIAMRAGFSHMGEFAALYKKAYGVSPSHTLWRAL
jgi:transcriptional regulator GlxA family with amidase domain